MFVPHISHLTLGLPKYTLADSLMDGLLGGIGDVIEKIPILNKMWEAVRTIGNTIMDAINDALGEFVAHMLWLAECCVCKLLDLIYQMYSIFVGMSKVAYEQTSASGQTSYITDNLVNVLLAQNGVNVLFKGMAAIGIVLAFVFTLVMIVRKAGDMYDNQRQSMGQILMSLFKSILIILLMTFIMNVTMLFSGALMTSISNAFDIATFGSAQTSIVFTSEDFAKMYKVLSTIGSYSLNPSYNSRYNLNSCYNAIRPTLQELEADGIFDVYYRTEESVVYDSEKDATVQVKNTWQSVIQTIVRSHNVDADLKMDVYYEAVSDALLNAMNIIKTDASFQPLPYYQPTYISEGASNTISLGTVIFLTGTGTAARNPAYNENVSITDALRGPYYFGKKSILSWSDIKEDFDMRLECYDHLLVILLCFLIFQTLIDLVINTAVRVFNLVLLYVVSPLFICTIPLGEGSKFKSWKDALIVTTFGVFGSFIGMRLMMLYIPIIASSNLHLFKNGILDLIAKAVLIWGGIEAADRSNKLLTGILMGHGGGAAEAAGDTSQQSQSFKKSSGLGNLSAGNMLSMAASASGLTSAIQNSALNPDSEKRKAWNKYGGMSAGNAHLAEEKQREQDDKQARNEAKIDRAKRKAEEARESAKKKGSVSGGSSGSSTPSSSKVSGGSDKRGGSSTPNTASTSKGDKNESSNDPQKENLSDTTGDDDDADFGAILEGTFDPPEVPGVISSTTNSNEAKG